MSYEVVTMVEDILVGAYGAAQGACTSIGGADEVALVPSATQTYAQNAAKHNAEVSGYNHTPVYELRITGLTQIGAASLAMFMGGAESSGDVHFGGAGGSMTEYTVYVTGMFAGGLKKTLTVNKVVFAPQSEWKQSTNQTKLDVTGRMFYDATQDSGKEYAFTVAGASDTTAPTISSVSPVDGATDVAVTTNIDVTFSEAIRTEDATDEHFFLHKADGTVVAATVSVYDSANTVVRVNPDASLDASTDYTLDVIKGIRDTAGNELVASASYQFTTAA